MVDFNSNGLFARLKPVDPEIFTQSVSYFFVTGEYIIAAYQNIRDSVLFTNKRIIAINIQGLTGKKKDFTSIPYNKITTFSLETAGIFDLDAELEVYISAVGKVKFQFAAATNVMDICRLISMYALE